jgi:uncharacterized damage-inducible protein DinB
MKRIDKPSGLEYPTYASIYMQLIPDDGLLLQHLTENMDKTLKLIRSLPSEKLQQRPSEKKWTIKEIMVHITDDERIYAYRALRFARNDQTELPGFEQDDYIAFAGAHERSIANILEEYVAVRRSTIALFDGFNDEALMRSGIANTAKVTVRALGYHIAGHEMHHINIIKENYFPSLGLPL